MEFITVEQFKEQPLEVQKVFLDWWKCEHYDIYAWAMDLKGNKWCIENCTNQIQADTINKGKTIEFLIPLFTEGQLRKFIEDKLDMKIQCEIHPLTLDYIILVKNNSGNKVWMHTGKEDLLQAYWKVACMIAKEG